MDDYIIYDEIGKGRRSVVYKGRKSGTLVYLALQRYSKENSEHARTKLANGKGFDHPNVVTLSHVWETETAVWVAMEYCPGGNLESLLRTDVKIPVASAKQLILDLAAGLRFCHSRGLVLGDVMRPAKVLVDDGWIKVGELGGVLRVDADGHAVRPLHQLDPIGCLYFAPELVKLGSAAVTYRSDLWALGCMLYEMIVGHPPFVSDDSNELGNLITSSGISVSALSAAPNSVVTLILGLLEKSPSDRYGWKELAESELLRDDLEYHPTESVERHFHSVLSRTIDSDIRHQPVRSSPTPTSNLDSAFTPASTAFRQDIPVMPDIDLDMTVQGHRELRPDSVTPTASTNRTNKAGDDQQAPTAGRSSSQSSADTYSIETSPLSAVHARPSVTPEASLPPIVKDDGASIRNSTGSRSKSPGVAMGLSSFDSQKSTVVLPKVSEPRRTNPSYSQLDENDHPESANKNDTLSTETKSKPALESQKAGRSMLPRRVSHADIQEENRNRSRKTLGNTYEVVKPKQKQQASRSEVPLEIKAKESQKGSPVVIRSGTAASGKTSPRRRGMHPKLAKRGKSSQQLRKPSSAKSNLGQNIPASPVNIDPANFIDSAIVSLVASSGSIESLFFHDSDASVSPLVGNSKIEKVTSQKYKEKYGNLVTYSMKEWEQLDDDTLISHVDTLHMLLSMHVSSGRDSAPQSRGSSRSAGSANVDSTQQLGHALSYLHAVCASAEVANVIANSDVFGDLTDCVKGKLMAESIRSRAASVIGLVLRQATLIDDGVNMTHMMIALTDSCREQYRIVRLKRRLVAALGETLFYVATQAASSAEALPDHWRVPDQTYSLLHRILGDSDDQITVHYAVKTIENVTSISGAHAHALATNVTGLQLWTIFVHSSESAIRRSCIWGIARICQLSPSVLQHVTDKGGLTNVLEAFRDPSNRVKQPIINAFLFAFAAGSGLPRLISSVVDEPKLVDNIMSIIERVPNIIRAKLYLLLGLAFEKDSTGVLLVRATQLRLLTVIGRDDELDDDPPVKGVDTEQCQRKIDSDRQYLLNCAAVLVRCMSIAIPAVLTRLEAAVITVSCRKRPSGTQAREFRNLMLALPGVLSGVLSHILRPLLYSDAFLESVAAIVRHLPPIDLGSTDLGDVSVTAKEDLVRLMTCVAEAIVQHSSYTDMHIESLLRSLLPAITALLGSSTKETRLGCLKILLDAAAVVNYHISRGNLHNRETWKQLTEEFCDDCLFSTLTDVLKDDEPIPVYATKLLNQLCKCLPNVVSSAVNHGLCPQIVGLLQHRDPWTVDDTVPLLDSTYTVELVAAMMQSPSLSILEIEQSGAASKIVGSLEAAFALSEANGQELILPLLKAAQNILQQLEGFAPLPSDETISGEEPGDMNVAAKKIGQPFRRVWTRLLSYGVSCSHEAAICSLKCARLILLLFPAEQAQLSDPGIRKIINTAQGSQDEQIEMAALMLLKFNDH